jgi:hypothetical protein
MTVVIILWVNVCMCVLALIKRIPLTQRDVLQGAAHQVQALVTG